MSFAAIRFWLAVVMLTDAAVGLLGARHWQRMAPRVNIQRIALIEAAAALIILAIHFWAGG